MIAALHRPPSEDNVGFAGGIAATVHSGKKRHALVQVREQLSIDQDLGIAEVQASNYTPCNP